MSQQPQYTMNSANVLSVASQFFSPLGQLISLEASDLRILAHILIYASSRNLSISRSCEELSGVPPHYDALKCLRDAAENLKTLTKHLNDILAQAIPKSFSRSRRKFAIDVVQIPYQGRVEQRFEDQVCNSQAKGGTTRCFLYATACCLFEGRRYTVAMTPCQKGETMDVILKRLMRRLSFLGLKVKFLLLDREFFSVKVIRYLQRKKTAFIMPARKTGKSPKHEGGPTGTYRFACLKRSCWVQYKMKSNEQATTFDLAVVCVNSMGRNSKNERVTFLYATYGMRLKPARWIRETYRKRFGIEASYRQMHQLKIRTSTRHAGMRLMLIGVALILRNLWVWLHIEVIAAPNQRARKRKPSILRLNTMMLWCLIEILRIHPPTLEIPVYRDVLSKLFEFESLLNY